MADLQSTGPFARTGVTITERPLALSMLRIDRESRGVGRRLGKAFNMPWPDAPNTVAQGDVRVAWMAPREWAVFATGAEIEAIVASACKGHLHHLADVSAGRRLWRVEGAHSRALIARGCSLDTHPKAMSAGQCGRTLFAQIPILLLAREAGNSFEIVADVSFAGHLRAWFADATQGFPQ